MKKIKPIAPVALVIVAVLAIGGGGLAFRAYKKPCWPWRLWRTYPMRWLCSTTARRPWRRPHGWQCHDLRSTIGRVTRLCLPRWVPRTPCVVRTSVPAQWGEPSWDPMEQSYMMRKDVTLC